MGLDDVAADGEAESGASQACGVGGGLGREERVEDAFEDSGGHAGARIGDGDFSPALGGIQTDAEGERAALGHGLTGIDDEIQENLLNLGGINACGGTGVDAEIDGDTVFFEVFCGDAEDILDEAGEVGGVQAVGLGSGEGKHAGGDSGGAFSAFQDAFQGFLAVFGIVAAEPELGVVEDWREGVIEFVADGPGDDAQRRDALECLDLPAHHRDGLFQRRRLVRLGRLGHAA